MIILNIEILCFYFQDILLRFCAFTSKTFQIDQVGYTFKEIYIWYLKEVH